MNTKNNINTLAKGMYNYYKHTGMPTHRPLNYMIL